MSKFGKKVFIAVRHGCHDRQHELTADGMVQMTWLAMALRAVATKRNLHIEILSSSEPCALAGAQVIAKKLGIEPEKVMAHDCFWADISHRGDCQTAVKVVEALFRDGTLLLLVSNVMMTHRLVRYIAAKEGFDAKMDKEIEHGHGLMVAQKGVSLFPRPK